MATDAATDASTALHFRAHCRICRQRTLERLNEGADGGPGVAKSRLIEEFHARLREVPHRAAGCDLPGSG